nr:unnamed protein product [Callosobruchus analis]
MIEDDKSDHFFEDFDDDNSIADPDFVPNFDDDDDDDDAASNHVGVEKTDKKHYKDKKDCCIFCDKDVTHFGRHLFTWHKGEIEVQRIMSYDNNSKERRHELLALRKRGNFIKIGRAQSYGQ